MPQAQYSHSDEAQTKQDKSRMQSRQIEKTRSTDLSQSTCPHQQQPLERQTTAATNLKLIHIPQQNPRRQPGAAKVHRPTPSISRHNIKTSIISPQVI